MTEPLRVVLQYDNNLLKTRVQDPQILKVRAVHESINPSSLFQTIEKILVTNDPDQVVGTFPSAQYRSVKYFIQFSYGSEFHLTEVLLMHDGTDVHTTEYGTIYTSEELGTISGEILDGYVRILASPTYTNTKISMKGILIPS